MDKNGTLSAGLTVAPRRLLAKVYYSFYHNLSEPLKHLASEEFASVTQVGKCQVEKLTNLLVHAATKVPYYRDLLRDVGVVRSNGKTIDLDKFRDVPLLDKDTIRTQLERLESKDLAMRNWQYNTSGGSTGEPVRFIQDEQYNSWVNAVKLLFDEWTGYFPGMRKVMLWGSERDLFVGRETFKVRVGRWIRNELWLNAFRMRESDMRRYVEWMNAFRPQQILAYAESIYELARFIEQEVLKVYSPKAIMTSAGTLYPHMREVIERVFNAPVFNRYGSREVGDIACECDVHKGLHVSPLTHYIEILREDGTPTAPGEVGEVVVTSLVNYAMPLIRYRIGDMAVWAEEKCSCGRAWPMLKEVVGRVTDVFTRLDGARIVPEYFIHIIGVVLKPSWLRKFQVIQEDYNYIRFLVVPSIEKERAQELAKKEEAGLKQKVRLVMGDECKVDIEFVEDIAPSPSGKYRYTISKVSK